MGRLLASQRLAAIARRWEANMDAQAVVLPARFVDAGGGEVETTYPAPTDTGLTTYPCRIQAASAAEEAPTADQWRGKIWWDVQLPVTSRINPSDRLSVTGRDARGGTYTRLVEVAGPAGPRTWGAVRIVRGWEVLPDAPLIDG